MEYVKLGTSGLEVSQLALGGMSYGTPERGPHPWTLDEEQARPLVKRALDAGITFFDTANSYSQGTCHRGTEGPCRAAASHRCCSACTARFGHFGPAR